MVWVFNFIGMILIVIGGLITFGAFAVSGQAGPAILARIAVAAPGLGIAFSGLLCMAIAGVLSRLDRIVNNTADIADALDDAKAKR